MDDTDLSGLDLDSAKEYIFGYAIDVKRLDKDIADAGVELERWKGRVALAEGKLAAGDQSMATLVQAAQAKLGEEAGKVSALEAERAELRAKINRMREQLPTIKASERSIDPDRLLAELQLMTGELLGGTATEAGFTKLEADAKADAELDALKRRASGGPNP
jgi:chromosome segregation ATPase